MNRISSEINWSDIPSPIPTNLFERYIQQSIHTPIQSLGIDEILWSQCRTFAMNLAKQGFLDPISILYTSFKQYYPSNITLNIFTRWFLLDESNKRDFPLNSLRYPRFQTASEIFKWCEPSKQINFINPLINLDQIWLFFSISLLLPTNSYTLTPNTVILYNEPIIHKKNTASRLHCLFAVTPSGKYSNQLLICKPNKNFTVDIPSTTFTRIANTGTGDILYEHFQQWLDDFLASSLVTKNSALLIDPRVTILMPDFETTCAKSNLQILTTDLNSYMSNILFPFFSLFEKRWFEANRIDKLTLKSVSSMQRVIQTLWHSLRTLKRNEELSQLFNQTILWKNNDQEYVQSLQTATRNLLPKKKKKKILIKTNSKTKLPPSTMMTDPPIDSSPEQILFYILNRQISISRASKHLGGIKLDYFKYCLSYKMDSALMTGACLMQLNTFMQSKSTVDWIRRLRALYFWPCAKQLFLREIFHLTGIITKKRAMNICGSNNIGSIRSCDQQSPGIFWSAFEDIHQIQFDNESNIDEKEWNEDFQQYLFEQKLNQNKTQLWTIDTFEFPLTKKSTILQLPEWNELRPMNLTPKVTVIYAFSHDGQSTEPYFIFPHSFRNETINNEHNAYNDLGHLTPEIFLSWVEKHLIQKDQPPIVLIYCSRLPILSSTVLSFLEQNQIHPFGYPSTRILPFRYLFERRVRNNRSTNLMSEFWKKKLLDQQRSHVLKGSNCTVTNIKYYFEQIWPILINEKGDDEEENKTFPEKCQQAFQQANIHLISKEKKSSNTKQLVHELQELIAAVSRIREQVNSNQILKIKSNEPIEWNHFSSELNPFPTNDKRSSDENDQPRSSKRIRSSCSQTILQWIPPSKQLVNHVQSQSSSLFQFILSLIYTILTSSELHLTDEQYRWLHRTINECHSNYNIDKLDLIIETACIVVKRDLVR